MSFQLTLGIKEISISKINSREAARAIVIKNGLVLMVKSNKGDYKFPGGGLKIGENHEDALIREVREETGYLVDKVIEKVGIAIERHIDEVEEGSIFEMNSHYYLCQVSEDHGAQELDDYEEELDFCPQWITIDDAINENEIVLKRKIAVNHWVQRETAVLYKLHDLVRGVNRL
jgi:8-oxo-dGTP pyrophosphatase MutT (NUDIX family)